MTRRTTSAWIALLALLASGCLTLQGEAARRASVELHCPRENVVVQEVEQKPRRLHDEVYDVEACGARARYVCTGHIELACRRVPLAP